MTLFDLLVPAVALAVAGGGILILHFTDKRRENWHRHHLAE